MKASDLIARMLVDRGVTQVYEMVGGMITHLLDSIDRLGAPRIVSVHHEQAAAFAADGHGRMTGVPMVAMATSGPGATNLLTGIGSCHFDSTPAVFLTGQVNRHEMKRNRAIRQLGFQETDIVAMAAPITKAAWLVEDPAHLPRMIDEAFRLACAGRPGPVLLDIPMDVQRADIEPLTVGSTGPAALAPDPSGLETAWDLIRRAGAPLLLLGGGIRSARAADELRRLLDHARIPAVHSLMGVDLLAYTHPLRVGMIGSYGNRWANHALGSCDALMVIGSRLDVRQTGADVASFAAGRAIVHVDCEAGEMNNRVGGCLAVLSDARDFLRASREILEGDGLDAPAPWLASLREMRERHPDTRELETGAAINPNILMHSLSRASTRAAAFVVDVGQHQMWAAQSLELGDDQRFLTSGGMGSMGFALPAAIGAAFASNGRPIVVIAGDGGFQCNIHELQTVIRNRLPMKLVVLDNACHGMVRQFQESYFDQRYRSTLDGYSAPDFARVAQAYGIPSLVVDTMAGVDAALAWLWADATEARLLHVRIGTHLNAYPKLAFGKPITEMEPQSRPLGMEAT